MELLENEPQNILFGILLVANSAKIACFTFKYLFAAQFLHSILMLVVLQLHRVSIHRFYHSFRKLQKKKKRSFLTQLQTSFMKKKCISSLSFINVSGLSGDVTTNLSGDLKFYLSRVYRGSVI